MADEYWLDDPRSQGILGLASGLLQSSRASRLPITMGEAMGVGSAGMLESYRAAQLQQYNNLLKQAKMMEMMQHQQTAQTKMQQVQRMRVAAAQLEPKYPGISALVDIDPDQAAKVIGELMVPKEQKPPAAPTTRTRHAGDKEITEEWDAKTMTWKPLGEAPRWNPNPSPSAKVEVSVDQRAQPKFYDELGTQTAKDFQTRRGLARDAAASIGGIAEARKLLSSGMITGIGADYVVGFGKALQKMGVHYNDDAIANSEAFVSAQAKQVAQIIKAFGAGTGLSDADREFAIKAAAGTISLNEASIRKILDINERAFRNVIADFNKEASSIPKEALPYPITVETPKKSVKRTGTYQGRKVVEYDDGTVEFADGK